jgi:hypothetical protein
MRARGWLVAAVAVLGAGCARLDWQEYTAPNGQFRVMMPGRPRPQTLTDKTPSGEITLNAVVTELPGGAYLAAWADLPPDLKLDLDQRVQGIATRYGGQVQSVEPVEKDGFPGRAFTIKTTKPAGEAVGRVYQLQNHLYQLLVIGSRVRDSSADVGPFFSSFHLINPVNVERRGQ